MIDYKNLKKRKVEIRIYVDADFDEALQRSGFLSLSEFFRQSARAFLVLHRSGQRLEWPMEFKAR